MVDMLRTEPINRKKYNEFFVANFTLKPPRSSTYPYGNPSQLDKKVVRDNKSSSYQQLFPFFRTPP